MYCDQVGILIKLLLTVLWTRCIRLELLCQRLYSNKDMFSITLLPSIGYLDFYYPNMIALWFINQKVKKVGKIFQNLSSNVWKQINWFSRANEQPLEGCANWSYSTSSYFTFDRFYLVLYKILYAFQLFFKNFRRTVWFSCLFSFLNIHIPRQVRALK